MKINLLLFGFSLDFVLPLQYRNIIYYIINANITIIIIKTSKMKANKIITSLERFVNRGYFARLVLMLNTAFLIVFTIVKVYHL